jgi:hypothetical protein
MNARRSTQPDLRQLVGDKACRCGTLKQRLFTSSHTLWVNGAAARPDGTQKRSLLRER